MRILSYFALLVTIVHGVSTPQGGANEDTEAVAVVNHHAALRGEGFETVEKAVRNLQTADDPDRDSTVDDPDDEDKGDSTEDPDRTRDVEFVYEYKGRERPLLVAAKLIKKNKARKNDSKKERRKEKKRVKKEEDIPLKSVSLQILSEDDDGNEPEVEFLGLGGKMRIISEFQEDLTEDPDDPDKEQSPVVTFRLTLSFTPFYPCFPYLLRVLIATRANRKKFYWIPYYPPLPPFCDDCYSYAGIKMANHAQTLSNCGGRRCRCFDGKLTCEAKCKRRPAYHRTSHITKQRFLNALNWVNDQEFTPLGNHLATINPRSYYKVIQDHITYGSHAHWNPKFLPWHRCYLCEFEQMLQLYDVCVTIPYWYHPIDSGLGPVNYHVLDDAYLGDEVPAYGQLNVPWNVPPTFSPFSRGFNNNNDPLADIGAVVTLLTQPTYVLFRPQSEGFLHHYIPHSEVGGNMGNLESPADPLFWLHHGMVDRNWARWQVTHSGYNGNENDPVSPQWGMQVKDVIDGTGLWIPSVTMYRNDQLPMGDHCAVCYMRPFFIFFPDFVLAPVPYFIPDPPLPFDQLLADKFEPRELDFRLPEDPLIGSLLEANSNNVRGEEGLVAIAREDCSKLVLPGKILRFVESFNATLEIVQKNLCDILLRPVATEVSRIQVPSSTEAMEEKTACEEAFKRQQQRDVTGARGGLETQTILLPISSRELVERLGAQPCPNFAM